MKSSILTAVSFGLALTGLTLAQSPQSPSTADPSAAGANASPGNPDGKTSAHASPGSGSSTTASPSGNAAGSAATSTPAASSDAKSETAADSGVFFRENAPYLMQNGRARRIDNTAIPNDQMINSQGQTVPIPEGVSGFDEQPVSSSTTANPSGTPAATTSAGASTLDPAKTGVTLRDGHVFLIRDGKATRLDAAHLGGTFMMSLDGRNVPMPDNVQIENSSGSTGSTPKNGSTR